jgi:hypothetical protein
VWHEEAETALLALRVYDYPLHTCRLIRYYLDVKKLNFDGELPLPKGCVGGNTVSL